MSPGALCSMSSVSAPGGDWQISVVISFGESEAEEKEESTVY